MHKIESQLRFLAADSTSLLRGSRPSYREILLNVRDKLDVPCSRNLATYDLETEVFLHCLANCAEYVQGQGHGASDPDPSEAASFATLTVTDVSAGSGPGSAKQRAHAAGASSAGNGGGSRRAARDGGSTKQGGSRGGRARGGGNWTERVTAPFRLGLKDLAPTLVNLAGVVTVTKVGQQAAQSLASRLVCSHVAYQAALRAATGAVGASAGAVGAAAVAKGAVAGWGKQAMLQAASRSLTAATARYAALRGALSLLGPLMWGWLALDLALMGMGPDYARVVRALFLLSQVRLVRTHGFVSPDMEVEAGGGPGGGSKGGWGAGHGGDDDAEDYQDPGAAFL